MLQVFVASPTSISIIEHIRSKQEDSYYKLIDNVFVATEEQPYSSDQTYVAKSAEYLVFKQSSKRTLGLMPICAYKS